MTLDNKLSPDVDFSGESGDKLIVRLPIMKPERQLF